jgi:putative PEP-CTERM system TPR-repeat lipoprotein
VADDLARQRPNAPLVYNLRGAAHLAKQEIQAARTDFEHALKIDPKFTPAIFNLAQLDLKDGDVLSARKRYEAILAVQADNPRALLALAKIESDAGNGAKAVELLEQARDRNPKAVQPRLVLANYYFQTRRYEDALAAASEANQILPTDPAVLTLLGRAQLAAGDAEMAAKTLAEAVERRPDVGEIHHYLAEAQVRSGKWDAARASYMKALELTEHKQTGPLVGLARLEAREGNAEAALALTAELRQQFPDAAIGYEVEGDILAGTEKYRSATEAYRAALERAETSQVTVKLASVQRRAGDVADAEKTLADWLAKNPDDPVARLSLASAYQKAGRSKEATFQYEQVLKVQPKNPAALNNLAWLYYEAGNPRALEIAEAALEAVPSSPAVMDTAGWLRVQSGGRVEQGLELLRKAAAGLPGNAEVQYHLGAALAKSGDARNARTHLEAAVASTQPFTGRAEAEKLLQGLQGTPQTDISH